MNLDKKFLEGELQTLAMLRDQAAAQKEIWFKKYEQAVGAIDAFSRLLKFVDGSESPIAASPAHPEVPAGTAPPSQG